MKAVDIPEKVPTKSKGIPKVNMTSHITCVLARNFNENILHSMMMYESAQMALRNNISITTNSP
jgi:hypothetical protein